MKTFAWAFERAMEDGVQLSRIRPDRNNCIADPARLYHERDIKRFIAAVNELIDKTSGICEFNYSDELEDLYARVRSWSGNWNGHDETRMAANAIRKDIDADVIQILKGKL